MFDRPNLVYSYDGSFEGLLCCVFESYAQKEIPRNILPPDGQPTLFDLPKWIATDSHKAERVYASIPKKISPGAQKLVKLGFFTCAPEKEILIFRFLRLGYQVGGRVMNMLTDDTVSALQKAVLQLTSESHKFKGFIRFSVYNEALVAVIEPRNFVLPLLVAHFSQRFPNEIFMIYDKTHQAALVHRKLKVELIPVADLELPEMDAKEAVYRRLWKRFYETIAIPSRYNPRCRMNLMPKRYWQQLTEFYPDEQLVGRLSLTAPKSAEC